MVVVKPRLSPAEFVAKLKCGELDRDALHELVDGEVITLVPPYWYHGRVALAIIFALAAFAEKIGAMLLPDNVGYLVGEQGRQVRCPDVSLVSYERRRILRPGEYLGTEAPDLCVEVLSGGQRNEGYARPKVAEYFAAGAKLVWLVDIENRTVRAYEAGRSDYTIYSGDAEINLDRIASGFRVRINSFFPPEEVG